MKKVENELALVAESVHSRRSLGRDIARAFGVVLLFHCTVAVMAHVGLGLAQDNLERLEDRRRLAQHTTAIGHSVAELQQHVLSFTYSGHASLPGRITALHESLQADLDEAVDMAYTEGERTEIEAIRQALIRYDEQFQLARVDRRERKAIVEERFPAVMSAGAGYFRSMLADTRIRENPQAVVSVAHAQDEFFAAEIQVMRYVQALDAGAIRTASAELASCQAVLLKLRELVPGAQGLPQSFELVPEFERLMLAVVQSTRGYLHLVHVVMAGESAEFMRAYDRLQLANLNEMDSLSASIATAQSRFQWISALISLVTIACGFLASARIRSVVVTPLLEITSTFGRLANGERTEAIPGRDREDEIGAMAQAAEVFRKRNHEREITIDALEASNRELDAFAHVAAHDLKSPLRAIALLAEWIQEDAGDRLPEKSAGHLTLLGQRITRMAHLLDGLLAYAIAGRSVLDVDEIDVHQTVREAVELVEVPSTFRVSVLGDRPRTVMARGALLQVLQILVSNAVRHHDRSEGHIGIEVEADENALRIFVRDDGPGIALEHHQRIFTVFQTLQPRDRLDTSGVGLALATKILHRLNGSITIDPEEGRGSTFCVTCPIERRLPMATSLSAA